MTEIYMYTYIYIYIYIRIQYIYIYIHIHIAIHFYDSDFVNIATIRESTSSVFFFLVFRSCVDEPFPT